MSKMDLFTKTLLRISIFSLIGAAHLCKKVIYDYKPVDKKITIQRSKIEKTLETLPNFKEFDLTATDYNYGQGSKIYLYITIPEKCNPCHSKGLGTGQDNNRNGTIDNKSYGILPKNIIQKYYNQIYPLIKP